MLHAALALYVSGQPRAPAALPLRKDTTVGLPTGKEAALPGAGLGSVTKRRRILAPARNRNLDVQRIFSQFTDNLRQNRILSYTRKCRILYNYNKIGSELQYV